MSIPSVENCPSWVRRHRCMRPWPKGRRKLESRLQQWRHRYSPSVHDGILESGSEESQTILLRHLNCWVYHWATAGEEADGYSVASSIEQGIGFIGKGDLGGNPLFDLCLAVAVTHGHDKAIARFHEEHFQDSKADAAKLASVYAQEDAMEWWTEFLDELGGFSGQRAKLNAFDGRVGVRRWLKTVRWNFLRSRLRTRNRRASKESELPETLHDDRKQEIQLEQQESLSILTAVIQAAVEQLEPDAAAMLAMYHLEQLTNLQIASLLGVSAGTATRRRQRAEDRFRVLLNEQMELRGESLQSISELLAETPSDFCSQLFEILKQSENK